MLPQGNQHEGSPNKISLQLCLSCTVLCQLLLISVKNFIYYTLDGVHVRYLNHALLLQKIFQSSLSLPLQGSQGGWGRLTCF